MLQSLRIQVLEEIKIRNIEKKEEKVENMTE
jgi:hypothetical protein